MFEVGWTEMLVIAIVMIVVVGPKDLPNMLRTFGRMTAKMRGMANDFRKQFDEALKEAELEDVKKSVDSLRSLNPMTEVRKQLNPFEKAAADVRAGIDQAMKPKPASEPAVEAAEVPATPADPLKNGATDMPGVAGPDAMPAPVFPAMTDASVTAAAGKPASAKSAKKAGAPRVQATKAGSTAPAKVAAAKATAVKAAQPKAASKPAGKANGAAPAAVAKAASTKAPAKPATRPAATKTSAKAAQPAKAATAKKTARAK
jgi:sec-independent protein translocase protein TatB